MKPNQNSHQKLTQHPLPANEESPAILTKIFKTPQTGPNTTKLHATLEIRPKQIHPNCSKSSTQLDQTTEIQPIQFQILPAPDSTARPLENKLGSNM
jgi:hypothetical protein